MYLLLALLQVVDAGQTFTCTPTHVWDGDGPIWCAEGPKIRLAGIAAREIDDKCLVAHPCPEATGSQARDALVQFLGTPVGKNGTGHIIVKAAPLTCRSVGSGKGARTAAWCRTSAGTDLSCAMVQSGYALRWARYDGDSVCR